MDIKIDETKDLGWNFKLNKAELKDAIRNFLTENNIDYVSGNYDVHIRVSYKEHHVNIWPTVQRLQFINRLTGKKVDYYGLENIKRELLKYHAKQTK